MTRVRSLAVGALLLMGALLASGIAVDRAFPPDLSRLKGTGVSFFDRQGRLLDVRPAAGGIWRLPTSVEDVDPAFITLLIATEDRHFWVHPGVNPLALARAAFQDLRAGHVVSGGSTLTMQVARLLSPRRRTVGAKFVEIARAFQLEAHFSKHDILGMWLTLAPYGGNLEGVRAGSLAWFGRSPRFMEDAQAALLVAIPRRPEALRPDRHPVRARALRDRLLHADGGPVPDRRVAMPRHADLALPVTPGARVATTLDLALQTAVEGLAAEDIRQLPEHASVAFLVADLQTREVRALTSGAPGWDHNAAEGRAGALDLTQAVRSPGSALKPFIYALAFEAGHAGPNTLLDDLPRRFGGYAPEDFDRAFSGPVTMADALRRSLNLPAVALLADIGPAQFLARLEAAGIHLRMPARAIGLANPSLPLALGGAGTTLRDLAALYAGLGDGGDIARLQLTCCASPLRQPLLSRRGAGTIADILTQPFPDGGPMGVAWKTGTSWGGRDAWAMGFDGRHVAGVWVGRPDGTPLPGATGRSLALPLLAQLFNLLPSAPRAVQPYQDVNAAPAFRSALRSDSLRMLFPPPDSTLNADGPIVLRAMGGRRPLVFMIDGTRLSTDPARREAAWLPSSPGFYRITILDADGQAAHGSVRIRRSPDGQD